MRYSTLMPDFKSAGSVALWVAGTLVIGTLFRIGWEIGGKLWGVF